MGFTDIVRVLLQVDNIDVNQISKAVEIGTPSEMVILIFIGAIKLILS